MNENEENNVIVQKEEGITVKQKQVNNEKKNKDTIKSDNNIGIRIKWLIFGIFIGFLGCVGFYYGVKNEVKNNIEKPKINIDYLTGTIREMSDLISAELDFSGVLEHETEGKKMPLINKSVGKDKFLLRYDGEIKAGIDLSKVEISQQYEKIVVKMPYAEIKFNKVIPDSVRVYTIKDSILPINDKREEMVDAYEKANEDMKNNSNMQKLLNKAEEQAKYIIEGIIKSVDKDVVVKFEFFDNEEVVEETIPEEN